jgi:hypothetical protein
VKLVAAYGLGLGKTNFFRNMLDVRRLRGAGLSRANG